MAIMRVGKTSFRGARNGGRSAACASPEIAASGKRRIVLSSREPYGMCQG